MASPVHSKARRYSIMMLKNEQGFTLIELVAVIILLGILTITVAPKFTSRSGYAEYALRDQLVSAFRLAQQRATYDQSGNCYRLNIDAAGIGPQRGGVYFGPEGEVALSGDYSDLQVVPETPLYFDGLGNVYTTNCGVDAVPNPLTLTINPEGIQVEIFPTGFIRTI